MPRSGQGNNHKRAWLIILVAVLVLCVTSGCVVPEFLKDAIHKDTPTQPIAEIALNAELVEVSVHGNIAKIDSIRPGLDTYSFETTLYDLQNERVLCRVPFSEGMWQTALTDNGFYAVDLAKRELFLYDDDGTCRQTVQVAKNAKSPFFGALSDDERYFVYVDTPGTQLNVQDLTNQSEKVLPLTASLRDLQSFCGATLCATTVDAQLVSIDVAEANCRLVLDDTRITQFSSNYCIGRTDTNFLVANEDACLYVPFHKVDEVVIGIGKNGFVTTISRGETHVLRIYDLQNRRVAEWETDQPIESVCYVDDTQLLAVVGSAMQQTHRVVRCTPKKYLPLTVFTSDRVEETDGIHDIPESKPSLQAVMVEDVPIIAQFPAYPTGCESVSAVMALQHLGEEITVETFVDDYLPMSRDFYVEGGVKYGPSPYEFFIGHPKTSASYGCMAPVIERALCDYFGDDRRVKNVTGQSLSDLCRQYIDKGTPVLVWATINMLETNPVNSWFLSDGKRFTWPGNEHCMLLVGYDGDGYYFNDPYAGALVKYPKQQTEDRFAELGSQSLVITK